MPTFVTTSTAAAIDSKPVLLHCSANTQPSLPAEILASYYLATIDLIALAVAATSNRVTFQETPGPIDLPRTRVNAGTMPARAQVSVGTESWKVSPPHVLLSVIREKGLRVQSLRYENPFEVKVVADVASKSAKTLLSFLEFFNLAGANRRLANAQADREQIQATVEDSTIELMVDEKFLLLERSQTDVEVKKTELDIKKTERDREQLKLLQLQIQIARELIEAQTEQVSNGVIQRIWTFEEAMSVVNNVRLLGSIQTTEQMGLEIRIDTEN